ncbi:hypothetical protein [Rhodococcoides fascians]|uniref:hypothetical protein n=1 Tax=Rhodococcoides fascians TaxID=1828 RepID=UPI0005694AC2|nr:hypothetical protein [Rhodococcus fascians]
MSRFIDRSMVELQVEQSRDDVWVPEGVALPQRTYEPGGIVYDCTRGMAFHSETTTRIQSDRTARTFKSTRTNWVISVNGSGTAQKAVDIGPVLAHSRMAIPVAEGMQVNWSGRIRIRRTGYNPDDEDGNQTNINVRVVLWGTKEVTDEYGVESTNKVELLAYQTQMQQWVYASPQNNYIALTLPTVSDVAVPPNVDRLHLTVTMHASTTGNPFKAQYRSFYWGALDTDFFAVYTANPLTVYVKKPSIVNFTQDNALSRTGTVFRNRTTFTNVPADAELVLCADVGASGSVTVQAWDGATLLANVVVPAGARVVTPLAPAGGVVTLTSTGNYGVERLTAREHSTVTIEQTPARRYNYVNVIDDVNKITTESIEADLAIATIRFVSNTISSQLTAGKRIRLVAKHAAGFTTVYTGTIRHRRIVHSFNRKDQVELTVHTAHGVVTQSDCPVAYDRLHEYAPLLAATGAQVAIDGVDYTGIAGPLPDGWDYFPSYSKSGMTMGDSLMMVRNTRKAFLFVDRHNRLQLSSSLSDTPTLDLSDMPGQADMSYTLEIESGSDTVNLVNAVAVTEHYLDREDFLERQTDGEDPPIMALTDIAAKTRTIEYRRQSSIEVYGLQKRSFDVVRGTGSWEDLIADRYGTTFQAWASAILDEHGEDVQSVNKIRLTVTEDRHIQLVSKLQALDGIVVRFRGQAAVRRIRRLEHTIKPNKWTVDIRFDPTAEQSHWVPATAVPVLPLGDVDAGTLARPATTIIDGGHPADTVTSILDGGTL